MPKTNPIGTGTANINYNGPVDERLEIGREAMRRGFRSMGEFVRHMMLIAADQENPQLAARLREIRRRYYGAALLALFCVSMFSHDSIRGFRRPPRRADEPVQLLEAA